MSALEKGKGLVGIILPSSVEFVVAMFAAIKLGRGFVPIDANSPANRVNKIISECQINVLICRPSTVCNEIITHHKLKIIDIDDFLSLKHGASERLYKPLCSELVYAIYTSGSTGAPKGVPITHQNLIPLMLWQKKNFNLSAKTNMVQLLSVCFDFGIQEILTTLLFGGKLFIPTKQTKQSADKLNAYINKHGINTLYTTPSYLDALANYQPMPSLEVILVGGEAFSLDTYRQCRKKISPGCSVYNGYGPTEASINATMYKVEGSLDKVHATIPIGKASGKSAVYILDSDGWLVPPYVLGEIAIGGPGVSEGYMSSELDEGKFIQHARLGKLYKTGDLAYYTTDGNIEFIGRVDNQVKLRGHRIDLIEIENGIREALDLHWLTVQVFNKNERQYLVLFYYEPGRDLKKQALNKIMKQHFPWYMIPECIISLTKIPLNNNSKMNIPALRDIFMSWVEGSMSRITANHAHWSRQIVEIWKNVLGTSNDIGIHDNVFERGAHSILLPEVHQAISDSLGVEFSIADIYKYDTPYTLAIFLETLGKSNLNNSAAAEASQRSLKRKSLIREMRKRRVVDEAI